MTYVSKIEYIMYTVQD